MSPENYHLPVMAEEVGQYLVTDKKGLYVDCTLGGGGHSEYLLEKYEGIRLIGIDQDKEAIEFAANRLKRFGSRIRIVKGNFGDIKKISCREEDSVRETGLQHPLAGTDRSTIISSHSETLSPAMTAEIPDGVSGFLLDLGVSSHQLDEPQRGFSFGSKTLDMRMDTENSVTAEYVLNTFPEHELARIFFEYGEEKQSRQIAKAVVEERKKAKITSAARLEGLVERVKGGRGRINPATLVFQALRIQVNDELGKLKSALDAMPGMLLKGGRIVVLSYHSLEDRIAKQSFRKTQEEGLMEILTKKVLCARDEEQKLNPRSRSAKLRCSERI